MRQPRFAMGEKVCFYAEFECKPNKNLVRKIKLEGIVKSVGYDPSNMSTGRPFYEYSIISGQAPFYHIKEQDLESVEG